MTLPTLPPKTQYQNALADGTIKPDPAQAEAIESLQKIYEQLLAKKPSKTLRGEWRWPAVQGLYAWGGVGRGKTWLMDMFFASLPFSRKKRTHFHRFMQEVHARRTQYAQHEDPLKLIARDLAQEARVICFDEFFVSDIGDAMILGRLTEKLFDYGVTIIATSNIPPDDLYRGGLQRERFLPVIALLKKNNLVLNIDSGVDYRLRQLEAAHTWHLHTEQTPEIFQKLARDLAPHGQADQKITVMARAVPCFWVGGGVAGFEFAQLCETNRSAGDYVEIAEDFHTVLLLNIPILDKNKEDAARRFVYLVDEFYDRNVRLIVSAQALPEQIYCGERLVFEFQRTLSRLTEMQSQDYLSREHHG